VSHQGGVTRRAVVTGLVLLAGLIPVAFHVDLAWNKGSFFAGIPAMAPVVVLFLLAALMSVPVLRRVRFTRRELLVVYSILLVGGPVASSSIMGWMLVKTVSYYYMARANLIWQSTFIKEVPTWFAPTDFSAVESFFEGRAQVPWSLWWTPLTAWALFAACLFVASFCVVALLQRQWITHERLSFPLAQVPLELVGQSEDGSRKGVGRLPIQWLFWIGLALSFAVAFLNGLSQRVPSLPAVPLGPVAIVQWQRVGPLAGLGEITLYLPPWMIAIAYLIPKELSFSAWFFWLVDIGLTVLAIVAGADPQRPEEWFDSSFPAPRYQGGGAILALGIWVIWIGRKHILRSLRVAFSREAGAADKTEPLSYRLAVLGFLLSFAGLVYFCWAAGCRLLVGFMLMALLVGYYMMWARLRAETGLGFLPFPLEIQEAVLVPFGSGVFRAKELVAMISMRWSFFPGFGASYEVVTGNALETFKIADTARINQRRLAVACAVGFFLALIVSLFVYLRGIYSFGFFGLKSGTTGWLGHQSLWDGNRIVGPLTNPSETDVNGLVAILAGGAFAIFLGLMRLRFWWWPFHPVGYMAAMCWGLHWYYMPFFIGWAAKTLVIRYGGLRLYRQTVLLAIGLIVGDLLNSGVWAVVALATGGAV